MRVRWSALARWVGGGIAVLLALQALSPLLRPPPPAPLAADIGLPRVRPRNPFVRPARVARVSPARALPGRHRADRRRAPGRRRPPAEGARLAGEDPTVVAPPVESAAPPSPPPTTPAPPPAAPPPPADGSVEFMPH